MNSQTPSVLILGANGRLGAAATLAFAAAGWHVRAQSRQARSDWPEGVQAVLADALQPEALCHAALGVDVIVNALNPVYTEWERLARPLAASALAAAQASGALLMLPGNVYNFGRDLPAELREDTAQVGNHGKARIRIEMEEQLRQAAAAGVNSVVLRCGDFFGGSVRGAWFDLGITKELHHGKLIYPGPTDLPHAWAYLPDVAQTLVLLATQRAELRGARSFHFGGHTLSGVQLHQALEQLTGRRLQLRSFPWGMIRLAALVSPMPRALLAMRYLWQRPHRLRDSALRAALGSVPHTPLPQALAAALRALDLFTFPTTSAPERA